MRKKYTYKHKEGKRFKVDDALKKEILDFYLTTGESVRVVAETFDVSRTCADNVINGYLNEQAKKWKQKK